MKRTILKFMAKCLCEVGRNEMMEWGIYKWEVILKCLYSVVTNVVGSVIFAKNIADVLSNGVTTLEMTRVGKNLTTLTKGMPWSEAEPMWKRLSTVYAKGAKGTIHVFQSSRGVGINSIWGTVEYPILKQNG